jgi:hypothetical protein
MGWVGNDNTIRSCGNERIGHPTVQIPSDHAVLTRALVFRLEHGVVVGALDGVRRRRCGRKRLWKLPIVALQNIK